MIKFQEFNQQRENKKGYIKAQQKRTRKKCVFPNNLFQGNSTKYSRNDFRISIYRTFN